MNWNKINPVFGTERLTFHDFEVSDIQTLIKLCNDEEIAANTLAIPSPYTEKDALRWVYNSQNPDSDGERGFAIWTKGTSTDTTSQSGAHMIEILQPKLIGSIGFSINFHKRATVGYWIGKEWRRQGYASEALKGLINHIFTQTNTNVVGATHMPHNKASGLVMQKAGMKYEGTLRGWAIKDGKSVDAVSYSIVKGGL